MPACTDYIKTIYPDECVGDSLSTINNNFSALQVVTCELEQRFDKNKQVRTFFYYGPNARVDATSGMADNSTSRPSDLTIQSFVNSTEQLNLPLISKDGDTAYVVYQKTGFKSTLGLGIPTDNGLKAATNTIQAPEAPLVPSPGSTVNLSFGVTYNLRDFWSAGAGADGGGNNLVTLYMNINGANYSHRASGGYGDDTYIGFNRDSVYIGEGYPNPPSYTAVGPGPGDSGTFSFGSGGGGFGSSITAVTKVWKPGAPGNASTFSYNTTKDIITEFSPVLIIWKLSFKDNFYTVDVGFPRFTRASTSNSNFTNWNNPTAWSQY